MNKIRIVENADGTWYIPEGAEEVRPAEGAPLGNPPVCRNCDKAISPNGVMYSSRIHSGEEVDLCEECDAWEMEKCPVCGVGQVDEWARRQDRAVKFAVPGEEPAEVCEECRKEAPR